MKYVILLIFICLVGYSKAQRVGDTVLLKRNTAYTFPDRGEVYLSGTGDYRCSEDRRSFYYYPGVNHIKTSCANTSSSICYNSMVWTTTSIGSWEVSLGYEERIETYDFDVDDCIEDIDNITEGNFTIRVIDNAWKLSTINVCVNGSNINLNGYVNYTSSFMGSGVSGSIFRPSVAGVGTHRITANTLTANGILQSGIIITVIPYTDFTFSSLPVMCSNSDDLSLRNFTSIDASFSGVGVSGTRFSALTAGAGVHTITASFTNGSGCVRRRTRNIVVTAEPTVNAGANFSRCFDAPNVTLIGSPSGGTWSGLGVSSNTWDPSNASGLGTKTLTYTYTIGGCTISDTRIATVNALPIFTFYSLQSRCLDDADFDLQSYTSLSTVFSGTGVVGDRFFSNVSGVGTFTISATSTNGDGCSTTSTRTITVTDSPSVNAGSDLSICSVDGIVSLVGSPSGGNWSGDGVSGNTFYPGQVAEGAAYILTYTFNNGVCLRSDTRIVTVKSTPNINFGTTDQIVCVYEGGNELINYDLNNYTYSPTGGTWSSPNSVLNSIINGSNLSLEFLANGSIYSASLIYRYVGSNGCSASRRVQITVNKETGNGIVATGDEVCGDGVMTLTVAPLSPSSDFEHVWFLDSNKSSVMGIGDSYTTPNLTSTRSYFVGKRHKVNNCVSSLKEVVAIVNANPTVEAGIDKQLCTTTSTYILNGDVTPLTGGIFSGSGIRADGITFDAALVGIGDYTITYSYTNPTTGCVSADTKVISVGGLREVIDAGINISECFDHGIVDLDALPSGGTWTSSNSIVNGKISNGTSTIDIENIPPGVYTLTYSKVASGGCILEDNITLEIFPKPTAPIANNGNICAEGTSVLNVTGIDGTDQVQWFQNPDDNTPFFTGVSYETPTVSVTTIYFIRKVTSNGCASEVVEIRANVNVPPSVEIGEDLFFCQDNINYDLLEDVNLQGGTFSGTGVSGNFFVGGDGSGEYIVTYTFVDGYGCAAIDTRTIDIGLNAEIFASSQTISTGDFINFSSNLIDVESIEWDFGDDFAPSTVSEPVHYFYSSGVYDVTIEVILDNGCQGSYVFNDFVTVTGIDLNIITQVEGVESDKEIRAYPNPVQSSVTIEGLGGVEKASVRVFSITGKEIISKEIKNIGDGDLKVLSESEVSRMTQGINYLVISYEGKVKVIKLIK